MSTELARGRRGLAFRGTTINDESSHHSRATGRNICQRRRLRGVVVTAPPSRPLSPWRTEVLGGTDIRPMTCRQWSFHLSSSDPDRQRRTGFSPAVALPRGIRLERMTYSVENRES